MIVISDSTPLRYLIEIGESRILKEIFGRVIIPTGVLEELEQKNTPQQIKEWIGSPPDWLETRPADMSLFTPQKQIGKGEHQAIALALELKADAILIDDRGAREEAQRAHLLIVPTLAILERAAKENLLDLPRAIERLSRTSFYAAPALLAEILERDRRRKEAESSRNP